MQCKESGLLLANKTPIQLPIPTPQSNSLLKVYGSASRTGGRVAGSNPVFPTKRNIAHAICVGFSFVADASKYSKKLSLKKRGNFFALGKS